MAPRESSKPLALSEEYVVDSSDNQDGARSDHSEECNLQRIPETPSKQKKTAKANKHKKGKAASPSTESSSSPQSQEDGEADGEEESEADGEEEGEVDVEEEGEDEPEVADLLDESAKQAPSTTLSGKERPKKKSKTTPAIKRSIPPKQYDPPKDFVKIPATASDSAARVAQFLTSDLAGKEVWHITAPAEVSIESIKPFAIRSAMRGEPILNSEGKWYYLKDGPSTNKCTLSPNGTGDTYLPGEAAISRTFHLREVINPPARDNASQADAPKQMCFEFQPDDELPARPKRKQPKGLRMRYTPFGTTHAWPDESNAERRNIDIPDQIPSPAADRYKRRKHKSHESQGLSAPEADADVMEVDPSQTPSGAQTASPLSKKLSKSTPSKKLATEADSARQEKMKKKKKGKKNKDQETAST